MIESPLNPDQMNLLAPDLMDQLQSIQCYSWQKRYSGTFSKRGSHRCAQARVDLSGA